MEKVIAVANAAGSAGKTTTVLALSWELVQLGKRVLVVDLDGQANATRGLGVDPNALLQTVGDVLLRRAQLADVAMETSLEGLWLLPAAKTLRSDLLDLQKVNVARERRLRTALETVSDQIDVVLIDCPGALSLTTVVAMVPATSVLTVTLPGVKELEGMVELEELIQDMVEEGLNPTLALGGIVPCAVPPASAGLAYVDALNFLVEQYGELVTPAVPRSVRVGAAYGARTPLQEYAAGEPVAEAYREVLEHLMKAGVL